MRDERMKPAVGALLLVWALFGVGALVFSPAPTSSRPAVDFADYQALETAREGLPGTRAKLEALASREDGVGWQARILSAHAHAAYGEFQEAAADLRSAVDLRATTDLRRELAIALEAAGDRKTAQAEWEKLLARSEAVEAVRRLETDSVRLASLLVGAGRSSDALPLVTPPATAPARLVRARALAGLGKHAEAATEFGRYLTGRTGENSVRLEYGRALERAGEKEKALAVYRGMGTAGAYREGTLLEGMGRTREAAEAYLVSPDAEARWRAGRLLETLGEEDAALAVYRELASGTHRVRDDAALRAYLLHTKRRETTEAAAMAVRLPPAFQWLLGTYSAPTPPAPAPIVATPRPVRTADLLLEKEGFAWAEAELDLALRTATPDERLAIGAWYAHQGLYRSGFKIGSELLAKAPSREAYELAYPRAWWEAALRYATEYGVDPLLVLAVVREESNYSPTAVSSSNALGLMQLLPSTAKWIAQDKLGMTYREEDLFEPETNIRLGTWFLGFLLRQFDGDLGKAIAGYNGGPGAVERWSAAAGVKAPADLPGALGSTETREYLSKVLDAWLTYRWLYADGASG
jgi:soluble lytic murein transglycosylase